jgi:hypothetical protein
MPFILSECMRQPYAELINRGSVYIHIKKEGRNNRDTGYGEMGRGKKYEMR